MSANGFCCSACGSRATKTLDSRPTGDAWTRRRRACACGHKFSTYEIDAKSFELLQVIQDGKLKTALKSAIEVLP